MREKKSKLLRKKISLAFPKLNDTTVPTLRQVYRKAKKKILRGELDIATIH